MLYLDFTMCRLFHMQNSVLFLVVAFLKKNMLNFIVHFTAFFFYTSTHLASKLDQSLNKHHKKDSLFL